MLIYIVVRTSNALSTQIALVGLVGLRKRMSSWPVGITSKHETFFLFLCLFQKGDIGKTYSELFLEMLHPLVQLAERCVSLFFFVTCCYVER